MNLRNTFKLWLKLQFYINTETPALFSFNKALYAGNFENKTTYSDFWIRK